VVILTAAGSASQPAAAPADLLAKATTYVAAYEAQFSLLVAEERYVQETRARAVSTAGGALSRSNPGGGFGGGSGREERRTLRSDYLLVKIEGGSGWMPFRDVFEVDGRKVRDREDRLSELFLKPSPSTLERAARIVQDSTRHNIGSVTRTINIPTLALLFLLPDVSGRFAFTADGEETIDGRLTARVAYQEVQRPTLIKTTEPTAALNTIAPLVDLPVRGTFWIDPARGTILKSVLIASDAHLQSQITVTYRPEPGMDVLVPAQMEELYAAANDDRHITGTATYTNYRRFQVSTDEAIKKPPG
jgi:hypothetical protein